MFCPNCGAGISNELKFCRSCGMALLPVSDLVASHRSGEDSPLAKAPAEWERKLERAGKHTISLSVFMFFLLMLGLIPLGMSHVKGTDSIVLWAIWNLVLIFVAGLGLRNAPRVIKAIKKRKQAQRESLPGLDSKLALPLEREKVVVPSVTEQTTRGLNTTPGIESRTSE